MLRGNPVKVYDAEKSNFLKATNISIIYLG